MSNYPDAKEVSKELYNEFNTIKYGDLKQGDIVIFRCSPYNDGHYWFDGNVIYVNGNKIAISYLYGYKSLSDDVDVSDVFFKVDEEEIWHKIKEINYSGQFKLVV